MSQAKSSKKYMAVGHVEICREAKELRAKYDAFYFHKKLKKITNIFKTASI